MSSRDKFFQLRDSGPQLLPSMLLCDFSNLEREVRSLEEAGIQALHLDVMDGVFVPNFTYGMTIVEAFRRCTDLLLDVHLMIQHPERYLQAFRDAGADALTFHAEAVSDPTPLLKQIRDMGAVSGLAINPDTPVDQVAPALADCDLCLVMSVQAGFGGQAFRADVLPKLETVRDLAGQDVILEIDGGVNAQTIGACVEAGAEMLVAGSAIFRSTDYREAVANLTGQMTYNGKH